VHKPKVFVGSSGASLNVAQAVATGLEKRACGHVTVWDQGVFGVSDEALDRLLRTVNEFDFAVLIWTGDDTPQSKGRFHSSPRDNVLFECGLFMGALGRDRVFVLYDDAIDVKRPSDFAGVILAAYEGRRVADEVESVVRSACDKLAEKITECRFQELTGIWRSRYTNGPCTAAVVDEVDIQAARNGISIKTNPRSTDRIYSAYGQVLRNKVIGEWRHSVGQAVADGTFMLVINPLADVMYGYYTGHVENGAIMFQTWVLIKCRGQSEEKIDTMIAWAEARLAEVTGGRTPTRMLAQTQATFGDVE
jgi:hypothetical protein